jgi:hypothetical protein
MAEAGAEFKKGLDQLELLPDTPGRKQQDFELQCALGAVLIAVIGFAAPETDRSMPVHKSCGEAGFSNEVSSASLWAVIPSRNPG